MVAQSHNAPKLDEAKRYVLKIGSRLFVDRATGNLRHDWLEGVCADVASMRAEGREVVIVSSGAVALGAGPLGIDPMTRRLQESQAAAAAGQIKLAHAYQELLAAHGIAAAQVLLTLDDSENRRRYLNAANTFFTLLKRGAVPVVNENDTVATEEIRYGDNDRLAARVAQMISADCLLLLSDVDGFYTADPNVDPDAEHIEKISALTDAHLKMAGGAGSAYGSGGMRTKLDAARIAMGAGCRMVIASGRVQRPLRALRDGARATWFLPNSTPRASRKQWIAGTLKPRGVLTVDDGARRALRSGRSLLPAGVTTVDGHFERGDAVRVVDRSGSELGRGLVAYPADEARAIAGQRSDAIEDILGYRGRDELIHRDDLALLIDTLPAPTISNPDAPN